MITLKPEMIRQYIDSLPFLPLTVTRLMRAANDPESSAQDVMETILPDQSLCLTILKIANSALLGRPQKVDSLKKAVTVLGFNEVENIALAKAVISSPLLLKITITQARQLRRKRLLILSSSQISCRFIAATRILLEKKIFQW